MHSLTKAWEDRTVAEFPDGEIARISVPRMLFPAYQHLPFQLCEEAMLPTWVEVVIRPQPGANYTVTTASEKQDWAEHFTNGDPYRKEGDCLVYRTPIVPALARLWELREDREVNLHVTINRDGETLFDAGSFRLTVFRVERALLRHEGQAYFGHDVFGLFPVFVTPGDPAVTQFFSKTRATGGGRGFAVQGTVDRVGSSMRAAQELYQLIQSNGCRFLTAEMSARLHGIDTQLAKFPAQTLRDKTGNCLDYAVLFATLMEHVGHSPRIVVILDQNHAISGWTRADTGETTLLDVSCAAEGKPFGEALSQGHGLYSSCAPDRKVVVDIRSRRLRDPPVRPFGFTVPTGAIDWAPLGPQSLAVLSESETQGLTVKDATGTPDRAGTGPANRLRRGALPGGLVVRRLGWAALFCMALVTAWLLARPFIPGPLEPAPRSAEQIGDAGSRFQVDFPSRPVLLLVPLSGPDGDEGARVSDSILWPLVDRMIFNALNVEELVGNRLIRIDPFVVEKQMARREMRPPISDDEANELAQVLGANVLLYGSVEREGGRTVLKGLLRPVHLAHGVQFEVAKVDIVSAAYALADWTKEKLAPGEWDVSEDTLRKLFFTKKEQLRLLGKIGPARSTGARWQYYGRMREVDPRAVGPVWYQYLDNVQDDAVARELARMAPGLADKNAARFFAEVGNPVTRPDACADVDLDYIARTYPHSVGELGKAICQTLRGNKAMALRHALAASQTPFLRFHATRVLVHLMHYPLPCEEVVQLRDRIQRLTPEYVAGWSALAEWSAFCGQHDKAVASLQVSQALLTKDDRSRYLAAYHFAHVHLLGLEPGKASEWIRELDRLHSTAAPDYNYYIIKSLWYSMQGQFRLADETRREGQEALSEIGGDGYSMLIVSRFYSALWEGNLEVATAMANDYSERYGASENPGDRYWASSLEVVLSYRLGQIGLTDCWSRLQEAGDTVERESREEGRLEREANECLFLTHSEPADCPRCGKHVYKASRGNTFIGGCVYKHAGERFSRGLLAEAEALYERAVREIVWGRFLYSEFLPEALFGWAQSLAYQGKGEAAREFYTRLIENYARADRNIPEVPAARAALALLGQPAGAGKKLAKPNKGTSE